MLVTLDLTPRQATRVLAEALRTRATLEIEPHPEVSNALLWGTLAGRQDDLLQVNLHDSHRELDLSSLLGAMCDVRTILCGQLCLFTTHITDVTEHTVPRHVFLATPDAVQVANRRRFARRGPTDPVPLRLFLPGRAAPLAGLLKNIGPNGLACCIANGDLDELLFIGDEVRLELALPWATDVYDLSASVCSKTRSDEDKHIVVGFEFVANSETAATLDSLRNALTAETARLTELDGEL